MHTEPAERGKPRRESRAAGVQTWGGTILDSLKSLGWAVAAALVIRIALFEAFEIEGPSMEPGLLYGDRVIVAKFVYGLFLPFRAQAELNWGRPDPGDIIILASPMENVVIIKRVIGIAGDLLEIRGGALYRNGRALPMRQVGPCQTGYGKHDPMCRVFESELGGRDFKLSMAGPMSDMAATRVPAEHVFVMGDHRDMSNDSRNPDMGPIPLHHIKGRGLAVYWSRGRDGIRWSRLFTTLH